MNSGQLYDSFGRVFRKLRISVTDRCNFRCNFCMPTHPKWMPRNEILTYEEIARVASIFSTFGVRRIRLSGGEPLVREDVEDLVGMLTAIEGVNVSMTTNGYFLAQKAESLKKSGLRGVTVSLHSLKPERFSLITGRGAFDRILAGIKEAIACDLQPVKINCVVTKGCNEDELLDFAEFARMSGAFIRFIEYMPFDGQKFWDIERVFTGRKIVDFVSRRHPLIRVEREAGSTSQNYRFADGGLGGIGIITSMSEPFCDDCDRVRLTADGKIVPCLFSLDEYDLKTPMRNGASDKEIASLIRSWLWQKSHGVDSMIKESLPLMHIRPMHTIGG